MKKGSKHTEETKKKIAEALEGNDNSEKWTEGLVIRILNEMIDILQEEFEVWTNGKVGTKSDLEGKQEKTLSDEYTKRRRHHKKTLLINLKIWNADWFSDMKDKFKEHKTVSRLLKVIDMVCEVNTYNDAANGSVNSNIAKMHLSTHYNWQDKSTNTTKEDKKETDEEIQKKIDDYNKRNK